MSERVECFWIEPTNRVAQWLRRYCLGTRKPCDSEFGYHNAMVRIEDGDAIYDERGYLMPRPMVATADPRWPTHCPCGYRFLGDDQLQVFQDHIYSNGLPLAEQLPGAMWDGWWSHQKGPDGRSLMLKLPDRVVWHIDYPSKGGSGWTRTGEPPKITAHPSILTTGYHGWLKDGILTSC